MDKTERRLEKLENQMESMWRKLSTNDNEQDKVIVGDIYKHIVFPNHKVKARSYSEGNRFYGEVISIDKDAKAIKCKIGEIKECWINNFEKI